MDDRITSLKHLTPILLVSLLAGFVFACTAPQDLAITPPPKTSLPSTPAKSNPTNLPLETAAASPTPIDSPWITSSATSHPSPTPFVCRQNKGQMLYDQLSTDLLHHPIDFRVYLPPCYNQESDRHYPVLYLIHGQSYNDDQWDRLGADEVADALISSTEAAPFIIVMPRYRNWFQPDEHNFGQAMLEVLIPYIDLHFRTQDDRSQRSIGGLSMGAAWALHIGLSHWELFGAIGLHSLALFSIDSPHIPGWLDTIPPDQLPRIYIDIGDKDSQALLDSTIWFEETLTRKGIPHEWYLFSGYHEENYWQEHTESYIRWYARDW
jgi:enterochelin esterase-like enzyme